MKPSSTEHNDRVRSEHIHECKEWRYLGYGTFDARYNMKRDAELINQLELGEATFPLLRFYRWEKSSVSLGRNQRAEDVINVRTVADLGYDVVVRPTGGRALLHKGDLCYAIASKRDWHPEFSSLGRSYRAISSALSGALTKLGVALPQAAAPAERERIDLNPCFARMSAFEIQVAGRKICGSAQFRTGDYFLQHGSIRVRDNWTRDDLKSLWPAGVGLEADRVTSIDRELGGRLEFSELERALLKAFTHVFEVDIRSALTGHI